MRTLVLLAEPDGGGEVVFVGEALDQGSALTLGGATLRLGSLETQTINQSIKGPHKATHGQRRSHVPAPPQGAANPASRSDAGLGGCE